jgi:hypothetical protein
MSTPKFDAEDLCDTVLSIMNGGKLNAVIAAVEAEKVAAGKGLTPTLAPVLETSYFYQTWVDKILNVTPGIFYGIEDVTATDGGGAVAKLYKIFVEIVFVDSGITNDSSRRINRYARALEELFAKAFAPALGHGSVKINQVRPMAFKLALDSDDEVRVGGISLLVSLV